MFLAKAFPLYLILLILVLVPTNIVYSGTVDIKHDITVGGELESTTRCAHSRLANLSKYRERVENLPDGFSYISSEVVDTGSEFVIKYTISVKDFVTVGSYNFDVYYLTYSADNTLNPFESVLLKFNISVRNPPTLLETYWPIPLGIVLTVLASFILVKSHRKNPEQTRYRIGGVVAILSSLLVAYGAIVLFVQKGIHIAPPFSNYVWLVIFAVICILFVVGKDMLTKSEKITKCMMVGCNRKATKVINLKDENLNVCNEHYIMLMNTNEKRS